MKLTIIRESDREQWEAYIRQFAASPFASGLWLESFRNPSREPVCFRFVCKGKTIGIISGLIIRISYCLLKKMEKTLFFFSGPAVLPADTDTIRACLATLTEYAVLNGYTILDLRSWDFPYSSDWETLPFYKTIREEYIIDLRGEWAEIQKKMKKSIKEQTRLAGRNGIIFYESLSLSMIERLVSLLDATRSVRRVKGYEDYSYFYISLLDKSVLHKLFQNGIARIFCARKEDKTICILLVIAYHTRAYALLIGTHADAYQLRAPAFLWFNTIAYLKKQGIDYLNLGGVANDSGAERLIFFKKSLGAEKHLCTGGTTKFLQPSLSYLPFRIYRKMDQECQTESLTFLICRLFSR